MDKKSMFESMEMIVIEDNSLVENEDEIINYGACSSSFPRIFIDQDDNNQNQVWGFYQQNKVYLLKQFK